MERLNFLNLRNSYKKTSLYQNIPDIIELISPLRKLGLTYFAMVQYDANNMMRCFTSDDRVLECYIRNPMLYYEEPTFSASKLLKPGEYIYREIFKKVYPYVTPKYMRSFNVIKDYCNGDREIFQFGIVNNPAFNNYEVLNSFTNEFKHKAYTLINKANKIFVPLVYPGTNPLSMLNNLKTFSPQGNGGMLNQSQHNYCKCLQIASEHKLSHREAQCLSLVIQGKLNKQISSILNISLKTVESYLNHISHKLNCNNKNEMVIKILWSLPNTQIPMQFGAAQLNLMHNYHLSNREWQCLNILTQGKTSRQIAEQLELSAKTIEVYIDKLKLKLKCRNKIELIIKLAPYIEGLQDNSISLH